MTTRLALALALAAAAAGAGCASTTQVAQSAVRETRQAANQATDAARRAAAAPGLSGVRNPSELAGADARGWPEPIASVSAPAAPNSLWRAGARTFFEDQRAKRIGDILTVNINIADRAEVSNSSSRSRSGSSEVGVDALFGLEGLPGRILPGAYDPASLVGASGSSSANGSGSVNREETVELTVAAVVVDVLANGNFIIAGRQEVLINAELRELTVTGVIRPQDIASNNTIRHTQIAEARIAYGGRGQVSAVQRPRVGQRIVDAISPW